VKPGDPDVPFLAGPPAAPDARPQGRLTEALRTQTRQLHAEVERAGVMGALLRGRIDRSTYCALLRNLHPIYAALEEGLASQAAHPRLAALQLDGLARREALAQDLEALHGAAWQIDLDLAPAARRYTAHLRELACHAPDRLAVHAYLRYLGDLSGGQILRGIVTDSLALDGASGTSFYAFGEPGAALELARRFRAGLDSIPIDADGVRELVAEARLGFVLHSQMFEELAVMRLGRPPSVRAHA
jgi:heme oxygenase (biliverdin-producing, ferredoxin)